VQPFPNIIYRNANNGFRINPPVPNGKATTCYRFEKDDPMRTFDLTPLYRATVGFDQIADLMDRALAKDAGTNSYPPYNIEKTADDSWRISIAVAGFSEDDLSIEVKTVASPPAPLTAASIWPIM